MVIEQALHDLPGGFALLDDPPTRELQSVAELAAALCGVPIAQVNFLGRHDQQLLVAHGMTTLARRIDDSLCATVRDEPGTVVVPDLRLDPRFASNPYVDGTLLAARFYASHPLRTPAGVIVGRLCVIDLVAREEHEVDLSRIGSLAAVAERVTEIIELALRNRQLTDSLARTEVLRAELEASHERLAAFAGQISHDLKTPLSSVSMSLEMVRDRLDPVLREGAALEDSDVEDVRWLADRGLRGASRMAVLVDDVLAYAQVGGADRHAPVDLRSVLDDVTADLAESLGDAEVEVGALPVVRGEHTQLRSLLQNLLDNAAKFRDPQRRLRVLVRARRAEGHWLVEVVDNGRGVAPEEVGRVFEPLVRAESSVAGNGIGLATCRRIVEAHGGRIGILAGASQGTTAWFALPA